MFSKQTNPSLFQSSFSYRKRKKRRREKKDFHFRKGEKKLSFLPSQKSKLSHIFCLNKRDKKSNTLSRYHNKVRKKRIKRQNNKQTNNNLKSNLLGQEIRMLID